MLFPTLSFAVFFAVVLPASWLLMPDRVRWRVFMIAASWFFYGSADWRFVPLLAASTVANHLFVRQIERSTGRARTTWTAVAVGTNLAALGWFKYAGFFALSAQSLLNLIGIPWRLPLPDVVLPIGISFFTFQALSYVIDTARGTIQSVGLLDFAVYLSFFPHLVAGPIVRASEFLPQIRRRIDPRRVDVGKAFWLITMGLFKKVVIASYLSQHAVDPLFGLPHQHGGIEAVFGVYAYAIQIYADFSGYTDMAIGIALLLGINFPRNFNAPYAASSLQEFWRRWHMTLSRWLRDYVYIPLGGSQRGRRRTYLNLLATMLLGGLWHGAAWTFVAWGAFLGIGLAIERWLTERKQDRSAWAMSTDATGERIFGSRVATVPLAQGARVWLGRLLTFHIVCLSWIFFRATSFHNAVDVLGRLFAFGGHHAPLHFWVVAIVVSALAVQVGPHVWSARIQAHFSRWTVWSQSLVLAGALIAIDMMGPAGVAPFIYFRF
jgi:D-alanyl-lipoteichoic acid acyltransferase DltB (MBOAT superfamily)